MKFVRGSAFVSPAPRNGRVGLLMVLALVALSSCDGDKKTAATRSVCSILKTEPAAEAAKELLKEVSHDRYGGGLAASLVITAVQMNCEPLLSAAITTVQRFFGKEPQDTVLASIGTFQLKLASAAEENGVANAFVARGYFTSGGQIARLVDNLCDDLKGLRRSSPAADLRALFAHADLAALTPVSQTVSLVLKKCPDLNSFQADGLLTALTAFLISNEQLAGDVLPPVVFGPLWRPVGAEAITISWVGFDKGGVASYELWVYEDNAWRILVNQTQRDSVLVRNIDRRRDYQFALRGVDNAGNQSGWVYLRPCLLCN